MKIDRFIDNPLITPEDVIPFHKDHEVIGAFNAGVASYGDDVLLLLRVAERPISDDPNIVKAPIIDPKTNKIKILSFKRNDSFCGKPGQCRMFDFSVLYSDS